MKHLRTIVAFLILVMASSPVLAAVCSISCAAESLAANISASVDFITSDPSAMTADHCHHGVADAGKHESSKQTSDNPASDKSQSNAEHKSCTMAGGCHFSQAASNILEAEAQPFHTEQAATARSIQRDVALAWLDTHEAQRKTTLYQRLADEMDAERKVAISRISSGAAQANDVLRLDT
ncbi:MAG: hypothetical protein Q7T58_05720 [Methylotenera sp.]|nr:hypothetical protein [Methylotenera sp.]